MDIKVKALKNFGYSNKSRLKNDVFTVRQDHFELLRKVYFVEAVQENTVVPVIVPVVIKEKKIEVVENTVKDDNIEEQTKPKTKRKYVKRAKKKTSSE